MRLKSHVNYVLFVTLALLALLLAVSALLLWVVFPRGYFPSRVVWVDIHKWTGLSLSAVVILHVSFHYRWLSQTTRSYLLRRRP